MTLNQRSYLIHVPVFEYCVWTITQNLMALHTSDFHEPGICLDLTHTSTL